MRSPSFLMKTCLSGILMAACAVFGIRAFGFPALLLMLPPLYTLYLSLKLNAESTLQDRRHQEEIAGLHRSVNELLDRDRPDAYAAPSRRAGDDMSAPLRRRTPEDALPNARFLFASFQDEITRAIQLKGPLSLVELDVNDFKEVNDRYGYPAGDRILRGVARAVRSQLRACDSCVRYAGDEFIVTVPGVGKEEIAAVQERIAKAIENHKFVVAGGTPLRVTASMGAATFPEDGRSFEDLIAVADARMYDRKLSRRNAMPDREGYQKFSGRRDVPVN